MLQSVAFGFGTAGQVRYDPALPVAIIDMSEEKECRRLMRILRILHLSDGRPGHYHLAEGVIAALARLCETQVEKIRIRRRWLAPGRLLRLLIQADKINAGLILKLGYGLDATSLKNVDLVISAGGQTLPANVAAARLLGAGNIFVGSLRGLESNNFSLIISSYERHVQRPRHFVTLKPSAFDPDMLGRPELAGVFGADHPPKLAGLLVGGDSGLFKYTDDEWLALFAFAREVSHAWGTRWLVSTSRRTPPAIAQAAFDLAKDSQVVADFIDYKMAGPGSLNRIFSRVDMVVCSEDSSTMISEAVWARLPVVGVSPANHSFKPEEAEYRQMMTGNNWCRFMPIAGLNVETFGRALGEIESLKENPLERLAAELKMRLPDLFKR